MKEKLITGVTLLFGCQSLHSGKKKQPLLFAQSAYKSLKSDLATLGNVLQPLHSWLEKHLEPFSAHFLQMFLCLSSWAVVNTHTPSLALFFSQSLSGFLWEVKMITEHAVYWHHVTSLSLLRFTFFSHLNADFFSAFSFILFARNLNSRRWMRCLHPSGFQMSLLYHKCH